MNRSYSKIRYIQETNQRLEKRLLGEQELGDVKPILSEQPSEMALREFRVEGVKYEHEESPNERFLVILRIKNWGSGEVYLEVKEIDKDLKTAFDKAIKKFESEKSFLNSNKVPGIGKVQPPTIDKLISK